jgi:anti-sigma factor RsiW
MSGCDRLRPLIGGAVLGALEPDEERELRAHLEHCPECAAEHEALADLPRLLDHAAGLDRAPEPSPGAEEALLDRWAREHGRERKTPARRRRPRLPAVLRRPRTLVAGALVVAAVAVAVIVLGGGEETAPGGYDVVLRGSAGSGHAALSTERAGTVVRLSVKGLPGDTRAVYELRCESDDGWSASGGTFRVDASGSAYAHLTTAARVGEYDTLRVVRHGEPGTVLTARLTPRKG